MAHASQDEQSEDYLFKVVLMGDSAVGKTNLASRYVRDDFMLHSKVTIGVDYQRQTFTIDGKKVTLQIWDTAGQERFRSVTSAYYRHAVGALVVYDITRRSTFENVTTWLEELRMYADSSVVTMLVGNKCDLQTQRAVTLEEGTELAEREGMFFIETSALDTTNVTQAFESVAEEIFRATSKKVITVDEIENEMVGQSVILTTGHVEVSAAAKGKILGCC